MPGVDNGPSTQIEHSLTKQMMLLLVGRAAAFCFSFATPLILVRIFSTETFGLYKQLLLIQGTLTPTLAMGFAASLYYFLPRHPEERAMYVSQTLALLLALGTSGAILLIAFKARIGLGLNNVELEPYIPWLAAFVLMYLLASMLEDLMVISKQAPLAMLTIMASEVLRATMVALAAILTGDMFYVVLALLAWAGCRLTALLLYLRATRSLRFSFSLDRFREQLRYALPFGLAVIVGIVADNLHQYVVSYRYSTAQFAVYTVGYLQIPIVAIAFQSVVDVTIVRLTRLWMEQKSRECARLIGDTVIRLSFFLVPLSLWLYVSAPDFIRLLFTERFASSVVLFRIFLLMIPMTALTVEYALRSFSDTVYHFKANIVRLVSGLILLLVLVPTWDLAGAAWATVLSMVIMKVLMLYRVCHWLKIGASQLLPWEGLGRILMASVLAGIAAWTVHAAGAFNPAIRLLLSLGLFAGCYAILVWIIGPITQDQKHRIKRLVHHLARSGG